MRVVATSDDDLEVCWTINCGLKVHSAFTYTARFVEDWLAAFDPPSFFLPCFRRVRCWLDVLDRFLPSLSLLLSPFLQLIIIGCRQMLLSCSVVCRGRENGVSMESWSSRRFILDWVTSDERLCYFLFASLLDVLETAGRSCKEEIMFQSDFLCWSSVACCLRIMWRLMLSRLKSLISLRQSVSLFAP